MKVNQCLNNIYRNNFKNGKINNNGLSNDYNLSKTEPLYDELFKDNEEKNIKYPKISLMKTK